MHCDANNSEFVVFECPDEVKKKFLTAFNSDTAQLTLIMARMHSRFRSKKTHDVYILIDTTGNADKCVVGYCCSQNGLRTVGYCSHVMSLLWFSLYIKKHMLCPNQLDF